MDKKDKTVPGKWDLRNRWLIGSLTKPHIFYRTGEDKDKDKDK